MKTCPKCKKAKPTVEFDRNKSKPDGLQSQCKDCKRKTQKSWYERHKAEYNKRTNRRRKRYHRETRQFLWDYLLEHPCVDCGETNPVVLEFDHVRGKKVATISKMVGTERPIKAIREEIKKCEVRCRNCHVIRTAKTQGWYKCIGQSSL